MQKYKMSILILFLICNSIGTIATAQSKKVVILDSIQSKKAIKDLIRYDYLKKTDSIQRSDIVNFKYADSISQTRIVLFKKNASTLETAMSEKQAETNDLKGIIVNWEKIYKRTTAVKSIYKYGFFGAVGFILVKIFLVK